MLLHGDGAAAFVPFLDALGHEFVVCHAASLGSGLAGQGVAETVDHEDGVGMDEVGDECANLAGMVAAGDGDVLVVFDAEGLGFLGIDPEGVFRHPLEEERVVDSVALGVQRAAAEGDTELVLGREFRGFVRLEREQAVGFELLVDHLNFAGRRLEA